MEYVFTGLDPATAYVAEVRAVNASGESVFVPAEFETLSDGSLPAGTWLDPSIVAQWLRLNLPGPAADDPEIVRVCGMTELYVERCRPDQWSTDQPGVYVPDAEVYQGAVMYAARELRRRNSPGGIETFADGGASFVAKFDADIERALRTGMWAVPGFG